MTATKRNAVTVRDASSIPPAFAHLVVDNSSQHNIIEDENEEWEDEPEYQDGMVGSTDGTPQRNPKSPGASIRRRRKTPKIGGITVNVPRLQQLQTPTTPSKKTPRKPIITGEEVANHAGQGTVFFVGYIFDILKSVIMMLKTPLKIFIFFWILSFLGDRIWLEVRKIVSPFCWIPPLGKFPVCRAIEPIDPNKSKWADFERLEETQSKAFNTVVMETIGNSALALDIKYAEMATADLLSLVKISNLKMKQPMEDHLSDFQKRASITSDGLQTLSAKVNGALDRITAVNDHAMATIEEARSKKNPSPWSLSVMFNRRPKENIETVITTAFDQAMGVLASNLRDLIIVAQLNLGRLEDLEETLKSLKSIADTSEYETKTDREEVLGDIWTWLGKNRAELRNFEHNLAVLKNVGTYREQARQHVVIALTVLKSLSADMEDMRRRAADPELMGAVVPVEVHIRSIKMGLDRMKESRALAREVEAEAYRRAYAQI